MRCSDMRPSCSQVHLQHCSSCGRRHTAMGCYWRLSRSVGNVLESHGDAAAGSTSMGNVFCGLVVHYGTRLSRQLLQACAAASVQPYTAYTDACRWLWWPCYVSCSNTCLGSRSQSAGDRLFACLLCVAGQRAACGPWRQNGRLLEILRDQNVGGV